MENDGCARLLNLGAILLLFSCSQLVAEERVASLTLSSSDIRRSGVTPNEYHVFVNGEDVGRISLKKTETKTFEYTPSRSGENLLVVTNIADYDLYKKSYQHYASSIAASTFANQRLSFKAASGSLTTASIEDAGFWSAWALKLHSIDPNALPAVHDTDGKNVVKSVKLDKQMKMRIVKESPPIRLARGTEKVIEDNYKIIRTVAITEGWNQSVEIKLGLKAVWVQAELGIREGIEKSTSKTYGTEEWLKRSVTLKGDGSKGDIRVVWVEYYRTGKAVVVMDGKEIEVPFEFKEDFDLLTEDVDME